MNTLSKILFAVATILTVVSGIFMVKTKNRERAELKQALRADSIQAQNDTLKMFQTMDRAVLKQLGDSLQIVTRQVVQGVPSKSVFSGTVSSRASVSGMVKGLSEIVQVPLEGDSIRRFQFSERRPPYSLAVQGVLRQDSVEVKTQINLDPVALRADIVCRPKAVNGVKSADVYVTGPTWLNITQVGMVQRPEVCNGQVLKKSKPWYRPQLVAGLGWSWQESNSGPAAFVGVGFGFHIF